MTAANSTHEGIDQYIIGTTAILKDSQREGPVVYAPVKFGYRLASKAVMIVPWACPRVMVLDSTYGVEPP